MGHAPVVERRGDDSVLACERCRRFFEVFVKGLHKGPPASGVAPVLVSHPER
jgi:hypothetical protein